jgi:hypothetical protein
VKKRTRPRPATRRTPTPSSKAPAAKRAASGKRSPRPTGKRPASKRATSAQSRRGTNSRAAGAGPARKRMARRTSARSPRRGAPQSAAGRWLDFVEQHGVVLASARGPVPSVAEAVAGQPIVGSWWAHPRGKAIFAALSQLDDSDDVRCFKLIDGKVTFVHRRMWPALSRLATAGVLAAPRVASIQQEHMPTGEHRNLVTPFPDWVPDDVARAATALTVDEARAQLGAWV